MSPSTSHPTPFDQPYLTGAGDFDVWKARVHAALDGKGPLEIVVKPNWKGDSDSDDEDLIPFEDPPSVPTKSSASDEEASVASGSDVQDSTVASTAGSDDELDPNEGDAKMEDVSLPEIISFVETHKRSKAAQDAKRQKKRAMKLKRMEAKAKAFLMKTLDRTHCMLVIRKETAHEI
jgi:hypothetical protein